MSTTLVMLSTGKFRTRTNLIHDTLADVTSPCLQDIGELEAGVGQSVYPLDHLGLPFNILRAFRRLLFLETRDVPASPLLRELPSSVVLHHLYSRAPATLQSPHVRHNFTPAQVSIMVHAAGCGHCFVYARVYLGGNGMPLTHQERSIAPVLTYIVCVFT